MMRSLSKDIWDNIRPGQNPFLSYEFFEALIQSGSIGSNAGWGPVYFVHENQSAALYTFEKNHSYGEYIFDWSWADAYRRHNLSYYPKLTSMLPFTPVTTSHFLMKSFNEKTAQSLLDAYEAHYLKGDYSSSHFLFLEPHEIHFFKSNDYQIRESIQYHFVNNSYKDFEIFLIQLKGRKAKQIRRERHFPGLTITSYTKEELTQDHAVRMYQFYISTIVNKNSQDYLNEAFFKLIFNSMKDSILYVEATKDGSAIAGSLFFYDHEKIYGRYWGCLEYHENLHFELCYYQGIDFCLKNSLKVFEAGAQGEHKIARGFRPIRIYSAHKIKHPAFSEAIANFLNSEKDQIKIAIEQLSESLPFR